MATSLARGAGSTDRLTRCNVIAFIGKPGSTGKSEFVDYLCESTLLKAAEVEVEVEVPFGSVADGLATADKKLEQTYHDRVHRARSARTTGRSGRRKDDKLTVWTGTQRPFGVRTELAEAFRIPEEVRVIVPDTGSGMVGSTRECAIEAARLATCSGKPVKLVCRAKKNYPGLTSARLVSSTSRRRQDDGRSRPGSSHYNSGASGIQINYEFQTKPFSFHASNHLCDRVRIGGLAATANLLPARLTSTKCAQRRRNPLAFRLRSMKDERMRAVLEAATRKFAWDPKRSVPPGRGSGVSCGYEKVYATCAEVPSTNPQASSAVRCGRSVLSAAR